MKGEKIFAFFLTDCLYQLQYYKLDIPLLRNC